MSRKALIVEDSPTMRQLLMFALKRIPGIEVIEAEDGVAGMKALESEDVAIILTDINMPVMDGLKFIEKVRSDETRADIPIVVISTEGGDDDRDRATALGATAFVTKPIQAPEVVRVVRGLLGD